MSRTFVIAEGASCHDGSYDKMLRLIDLASDIGADAYKTQWVSKAERLCERRHAPEYLDSYRLLEFPRDWLKGLANYCQIKGIEFMSTVYLPEDIEVIAPYVKRFKVASFEAEDRTLYTQLVSKNKPVIVSLGMNGNPRNGPWWVKTHISYLHCVSAYPTPLDQINLDVLRPKGPWSFSEETFEGLSDHTKHPMTGAIAVAAGAQIIEFHMRLHDTSPTNADYEVSRDPEEAREYVANIRLAEQMLGDGVKRVMPSEEKMLKYRVKG